MATATIDNVKTFLERANTLNARVDHVLGIIRGVKVIGTESRNGRLYPLDMLRAAIPLYEGAKVMVNHPKGGLSQSRGYEERLGTLRNVREQSDGLYADLHFNPGHSVAKQLAWDAEHAPHNVGLSHNVDVRVANRRLNGKEVVESILRVKSVDLVTDPATTRGLFESLSGGKITTKEFAEACQDVRPKCSADELRQFARALRK
jgi:hypothetical protein